MLSMTGQVRHATLSNYHDKKALVSSIIGIFCDCEYITEDEGFDSKLNFRLPFYTILEGLWKFKGTEGGDSYKEHIITLSEEALRDMADTPLFLRFVSLLIDDTNNMMGHGLKTLQEIRVLELKNDLSEEEQEEIEKKYKAGRSYVALSSETLNLFGYMSDGCQGKGL